MLEKSFTLQDILPVDNKGFPLNPALEFDRITASYPIFQIIEAIAYITCPAYNAVICKPEAQFSGKALAAGVEIGFNIPVSFQKEKVYSQLI